MKKILFVVFLVFLNINLYAQEKFGIYYDSNKIGYSRIGGKKVGNIAGAYFTLGLSSANSNLIIEGESAETKINDIKPTFDLYIGNDTKTEYIFMNSENIDDFVLIKLYKKKKSRNLRTGKYGIKGISTGIDEKDIQPINIEKISDFHYKIYIKESLKKGEYAFYYVGQVPEGKNKFNSVFDFSIK